MISRAEVQRIAVALGDVLEDVKADPEFGVDAQLAVKLCALAVGRHALVGESAVEVQRFIVATGLRR